MKLLYILLAIIYIISPIDLLPDIIPVIGWIDDLCALGFVGYTLIASD
jgi:uncharacterized membrane protein YkvA (DUF1232 family)